MGSFGRWDVRRLPTHPIYRLSDRCNNHPDGSALRILGYRKNERTLAKKETTNKNLDPLLGSAF